MNKKQGNVGERGEQYVIAQFSLLLFIAIGGVPFIGNADELLSDIVGPAMILLGIILVYTSVIDLKNNLSPWPIPTQQSGSSIVDDGIYSYIRHPMYAGVLVGMIGLSLWTESFLRLLLTILLFLVLDAKSEYEETKLIDTYGLLYEDYMIKVPGKFYPLVNFTIT